VVKEGGGELRVGDGKFILGFIRIDRRPVSRWNNYDKDGRMVYLQQSPG
jgi:hypothetical protein